MSPHTRDERRVAHNVDPLIFNAVSLHVPERRGGGVSPSPVKAGHIKVAVYKEMAHQHLAESSRKDDAPIIRISIHTRRRRRRRGRHEREDTVKAERERE